MLTTSCLLSAKELRFEYKHCMLTFLAQDIKRFRYVSGLQPCPSCMPQQASWSSSLLFFLGGLSFLKQRPLKVISLIADKCVFPTTPTRAGEWILQPIQVLFAGVHGYSCAYLCSFLPARSVVYAAVPPKCQRTESQYVCIPVCNSPTIAYDSPSTSPLTCIVIYQACAFLHTILADASDIRCRDTVRLSCSQHQRCFSRVLFVGPVPFILRPP